MRSDHARRASRNRRRKRWTLVGFVAVLGLVLAACGTDLPQNSLEPAGPEASRIDSLFRIVFWLAVAVFVLVEGALVYAIFRFRRRRDSDDEPVQVHGNNSLEILWTIIPALLLAGIAVPTLSTIFGLSREPSPDERLDVRVVGHQWWWEFEYPGQGVVTANELHIPTDRPVFLTLESKETPGGIAEFDEEGTAITENAIPVIHSFWVPRLGGKQDLVPGRIHTMTLQSDEPGTFRGQCAEFCGISHANMRLRVIAHEQAEFEDWLQDQKAEAAVPEPGSLAAEGAEVFQNFGTGSCLACHGIEPSQGESVGPNLTHIGGRETLAAGLLDMNEENLRRWLDDPRSVKPGVVMPDYNLTEDQIDALVAYLMTLE